MPLNAGGSCSWSYSKGPELRKMYILYQYCSYSFETSVQQGNKPLLIVTCSETKHCKMDKDFCSWSIIFLFPPLSSAWNTLLEKRISQRIRIWRTFQTLIWGIMLWPIILVPTKVSIWSQSCTLEAVFLYMGLKICIMATEAIWKWFLWPGVHMQQNAVVEL